MTTVVADPRFKNDSVFNDVSRLFITLKDNEMKEYNVHLQTVLYTFIEHMKKDPMFEACYRRVAYVGSYYEGLKVGKPEEFDLNIIIKLPIDYNNLQTLIASEKPGYIKLKVNPDVPVNLKKHSRWQTYKYYSNFKQTPNGESAAKYRAVSKRRRRFRKTIMDSWFDKNDYLDQNKFRQWFESVTTKALKSFEYVNKKYVLEVNGVKYLLHHKKSGPAWTLKIDVPGGHTVDVDLVPVLEFTNGPSKPFIDRKTKKQNWFAISKPLVGPSENILWRPSFYERELEILKGGIKQVIRQMKKLRDTQNFKSIASYYIKTLFLRELDGKSPDFQKLPSTFLFFYMLKKLQEACDAHEILDFWNPKNNLLSNISSAEMGNIKFRLGNIIKTIEKRIADDEYVIAEFILTKDELTKLKLDRLRKRELLESSLNRESYTPNVQTEMSEPEELSESEEFSESEEISRYRGMRGHVRMSGYREMREPVALVQASKTSDTLQTIGTIGTVAVGIAAITFAGIAAYRSMYSNKK